MVEPRAGQGRPRSDGSGADCYQRSPKDALDVLHVGTSICALSMRLLMVDHRAGENAGDSAAAAQTMR
jgi:hypothetical protein